MEPTNNYEQEPTQELEYNLPDAELGSVALECTELYQQHFNEVMGKTT